MSFLKTKLKVSINPRMIDKNENKDTSLFVKGWVNKSLTSDELAREIDQGVAYCCQLNGSYRRASNFLCSDIISVDVDGTRSIEDVMDEPIVKRCLTIFYTTPSHTPESHRFRLIFALPRTIDSSADMVAASRVSSEAVWRSERDGRVPTFLWLSRLKTGGLRPSARREPAR